ncbi:hypothetical protein LOD99_10000 [Oopsacas minuta]|uniref:Uncharacterized protein n=1 Tax=Oopsacas minuta TaxID=111878 RepID=A0AAV7KIT8_9METZ|nr:hypothetical protein LOD99_10000 [Oopsacas minuta]
MSVLSKVKSLLGPDVVLISHKVADLQPLQLDKNQHFIDCVDLSQNFSYYSPYYNNYSIFSLYHQANTLLGHGTLSIPDTSEACAIAMMKLFNKFYGNPILTLQACTTLATVRPPKSFARKFNYTYEGVCLSSFREDYCSCGAPIIK